VKFSPQNKHSSTVRS